MPTATQYNIVKNQIKSFEKFGCVAKLDIQSIYKDAAPKILIKKKFFAEIEKEYRFSDPDWNIVIMQLAELYKNIKESS